MLCLEGRGQGGRRDDGGWRTEKWDGGEKREKRGK